MKIDLKGISWKYISDLGKNWLDTTPERPHVKPVKLAAHHCVYYHNDGVYIKIFKYPFFRSLFRSKKRAKACKEGRVLLRLKELGFHTPAVLAYGESRRFKCLKRDVLISGELTDIVKIPDFIQTNFHHLSLGKKREIIDEFASIIMKLHQSGVYHRDLNFGNIFIQTGKQPIQFAILDVDKVKFFKGIVPQKKCLHNFGDFLHIFRLITTASERLYFLKAYGFKNSGRHLKKIVNKIEGQALKTIRKKGNALYRKSLTSRGGFVCKERDDYTAHYLRSQETNQINGMISNPTAFIGSDDSNNPEDNYPESIITVNERSYILKTYKSEAARIWSTIWGGFLNIDLPIQKPLIFFENKGTGLSHILFQNIVQARPLSEVWPKIDYQGKNRLLLKISFLIGYLHKSGCAHGALNWSNIAVLVNQFQFVVYFMNFEKCQLFRKMSYQIAMTDLASFLNDLAKFNTNKQLYDLFLKSWHKRAGFGHYTFR